MPRQARPAAISAPADPGTRRLYPAGPALRAASSGADMSRQQRAGRTVHCSWAGGNDPALATAAPFLGASAQDQARQAGHQRPCSPGRATARAGPLNRELEIRMALREMRWPTRKNGGTCGARWRGPDGTLESKPGFQTRKAAENYARDQEAAIRSNTYVDPRAGRITLTEWVNHGTRLW